MGRSKDERQTYPIDDVVATLLEILGPMSMLKLHRLLYYARAISLALGEGPLFRDEIQAWAGGPIVPSLWNRHPGVYTCESWPGTPIARGTPARENIVLMVAIYGDANSIELADLARSEQPWLMARAGLHPGDRGASPISDLEMAKFYRRLHRSRKHKRRR